MLTRDKVLKILDKARELDSKFELFGTKDHQYRLEPPVPEEFVREVEEKCGFTLPADYRRFITRVGDGGAGPHYGIMPFRNFWKDGYFQEDRFAESRRLSWRRSLVRPFSVRPVLPEDLDRCGVCDPEQYEEDPGSYFIWEEPENEWETPWSTDGFFGLGSIGCGWGYGIVLNGEKRGQVFTTDHEGGFAREAYSFQEFYSRYLEYLADTKALQEELKLWRGRFVR